MIPRHSCKYAIALVATYLLLFECAIQRSVAQQQPAKGAELREYSAGVLTADDYQAKTPRSLPTVGNTRLVAYTWVKIRYRYRYKYVQRGGEYVVTLSEFNAAAFVDRTVSWNASPQDQSLLGHEQGHFDIAHLASLQLRQEIEQLRTSNRPLEVRSPTLEEALKALDAKLDMFLARHQDASAKEHVRYDQMTSHGTVGSAQRQLRMQQREAIAAAERELPKSELNIFD